MFLYRLVFSPDKKTKPVTLGVLTHFLLNILIRRSPSCSKKKPLFSGPKEVVLDHDRDSTMISHDESLDMKNRRAMECCEAPTLEFIEKDSIY